MSRAKGPCNGKLYGIIANDTLTVLELGLDGISSDHVISTNFQLKVCGVFHLGDSNINEIVQSNTSDLKNLVVISRGLLDSGLCVGFYDNGSVKVTGYDMLEDSNSQFVYINIKG